MRLKRKSTAAFLMTLPLIVLVAVLVIYPAFYSLHLTLNKSMQGFVGYRQFRVPVQARNFLGWSSSSHASSRITAVFLQGADWIIVAHFSLHNIPAKGSANGVGCCCAVG